MDYENFKIKSLKLGDHLLMANTDMVVTHIDETYDVYPFDKMYWFNRAEDALPLSNGYYLTELQDYVLLL